MTTAGRASRAPARGWACATARRSLSMRSTSTSRPAAWSGLSARTASASRACFSLIAGVRAMQSGRVEVLGGDIADADHRIAVASAHRLHAAGPRQESLLRRCRSSRTSTSSAGCSARTRRARASASTTLLESTDLAPFRGPAGRQALRRHEAEARPVLLADPRSRSADPRRADHRRRSALAPAVLGADRPHPRRPARHERARRDRLHGRGRALRLAGGHGRRPGARHRHARRSCASSTGDDHARGGLHRSAAGREARGATARW